eukprot:TRINITY_DN3581_c0_g1_i2.p1 TRINITY_DN3581_c0_g1~~TRINITY_DN3581_c0_g1_i2.p1  ORF type:complete len:238 (-),score=43.67 TRINITY_DN3581_c0_g1_i2:481-1194(-)
MAASICCSCCFSSRSLTFPSSTTRMETTSLAHRSAGRRLFSMTSSTTKSVRRPAWKSRVNNRRVLCSASADEEEKRNWFSFGNCALCLAMAASILTMHPSVGQASSFWPPPALPDLAVLISGPPIKDPKALLRYALPIDNKPIREVQKSLEDITENLKVPGLKALDPISKNIKQTSRIINQNRSAILAGVAEAKKEHGEELMNKLSTGIEEFQQILEAKDRDAVPVKQQELLDYVGS